MGSSNQRKTIVMVERLANVLAESVPSSSRTYTPTAPIIWIRPQQVAHWPFMRHFLYPIERSDVIKSVDAWAQSTVQTENLVVD